MAAKQLPQYIIAYIICLLQQAIYKLYDMKYSIVQVYSSVLVMYPQFQVGSIYHENSGSVDRISETI